MSGPVVGHRGRCDDLLAAFPGLLVLGHLQRRRGHRHVGTVFGDQIVGRHREGLEDLLFELFDPQRDLGPRHLVAVDGVAQRIERGRQFARPDPERVEGRGAGGPDLLEFVAPGLRRGHRRGETLTDLCTGAFCSLDYSFAEAWDGRVERTETLATGGERCDFRWRVAT